MIINTMLSQLADLIEQDIPGGIIIETRTTFQNCLAKARLGNKCVYLKTYGSPEHYHTERQVLIGLRKLLPTFVRHPLLLKYRDELQGIIMSEVVGQPAKNLTRQLIPVAQSLKNFHSLQGILDLEKVDMSARIKRYQENVFSSEILVEAERKLALRAITKLAETVVDIPKTDQLVHGDLNASNILYDDTQETALAFIDFERTALGCGMSDVAKFVWRVLQSDMPLAHEFLALYLQKVPNTTDKKKLYWYMTFEYLGAISYFAYRGHKENYPYKAEAFNLLEPCLTLL